MLVAMYIIALIFTNAFSTFKAIIIVAFKPKTILSNKVTIYSLLSSLNVTKLTKVVNKFLTI